MFEPDTKFENALQFSRFDETHLLSTVSAHGFILEECRWPTAEHYYQCSKFGPGQYADQIFSASASKAYKLGNRWLARKRSDFKTVRLTLMTRALYSKTVQNDAVKQFLLETDDQLLVECSAYDHYWGLGRDLRGENHLGKIWMDIRKKLKPNKKLND